MRCKCAGTTRHVGGVFDRSMMTRGPARSSYVHFETPEIGPSVLVQEERQSLIPLAGKLAADGSGVMGDGDGGQFPRAQWGVLFTGDFGQSLSHAGRVGTGSADRTVGGQPTELVGSSRTGSG